VLQRSSPAQSADARRPGAAEQGPAIAQARPAVGAARGKPAPDGMLETAMQRLEEVIDQETAALRSRQAVDLKDFNDRKNHALLDLSRAARNLDGARKDPILMERLARLRSKLEINRTVLKMHLDAVREVATTLADAIRDADSDGTYSPAIYAGQKRQ
jgi:hypothetical protein